MEIDSNEIMIKNAKLESLIKGFEELGYNIESKLSKEEFIFFLNKRTKEGQFDEKLTNLLFSHLKINGASEISVENFINEFVQLDKDLYNNAVEFIRIKTHDTLLCNKLEEMCKSYREENLNSEGFSENAKITIKITDVDINQKLEGIENIIIRIIFNDQEKQLVFKLGGGETHLDEIVEFIPQTRNDHFEFIMEGVNDRQQMFKIGRKIFSLKDIKSKEEYLVDIIIPEINDEDTIVAHISANIVLYCSDYEAYEKQLIKSKKKLVKINEAAIRACQYVKKIRVIYGELVAKKFKYIVRFNNDKIIATFVKSLEIIFNNEKRIDFDTDFEIEFNNLFERIFQAMLDIEFINEVERSNDSIIRKYEEEEVESKHSQSTNKEPQDRIIIKFEDIEMIK